MKKGAIIFWGLTRGLKHTIKNLQTHLFDVLKENKIEYDIFIHTWYFKGDYSNKWHSLKSIKLDFNEYKLLNAKYEIIEDQDKVQSQFNFKQYQTMGDNFKNNFQSFNYHILSLISQKRIIEKFKEVKNEYDFVLFQRPDVLYKQKFDINLINKVSNNNVIVPRFGGQTEKNKRRMNNRWCLCNRENAIKYGTALDHLLEYSKKNKVVAEHHIYWLVKEFYKLDIDFIDIIIYRITPLGEIVKNDKNL